MKIQIIQRQCGGTEFSAQPHRLHLGGQNATGVDRLEFELPAAWTDCTTALYLRRSDGTQLAPIPLDEDGSITVDQRLTGTTSGQWMLAAVADGYTAYTRPGRYDVYPTLAVNGTEEELSPSLYEQFVARVLESASTATAAAQKSAAYAQTAEQSCTQVEATVQKLLADRTNAAECAARAEDAAQRAEQIAPVEGMVLSVNGKGGTVNLGAAELGALPCPTLPAAGELVRILSIDPDTGALLTDTTPQPDLAAYLRQDALPTATAIGGVRSDSQYGVAVRSDGTMTIVPASTEQLDRMTDRFAPLVPAVLPYGVKKVLSGTLEAWSEEEQTAAQKQLGIPERFYTKDQADQRFSSYTLPIASAAMLGGVKIGTNLTIAADGTLRLTKDNVSAALGYTSSELIEKLSKIDGIAYPDGKVVYSGSGTAHYTSYSNKSGFSKSLPDSVDYVKVTTSVTDDEDGSITSECKIARGGSGSLHAYNLYGTSTKYYLSITFSSSGTLTVGTPPAVGMNNVCNITGYSY